MHKLLLKFIEIPTNDLACGVIFRTFVNSIKIYLKYYHSQIITLIDQHIDSLTPVTLYVQLKPYMNQLK